MRGLTALFLLNMFVADGAAQTLIDMRTQVKDVDFSGALTTKPFKMAASLPGTCSPGEAFFKTNAPAGSNLYGCTAQTTWTLFGATLVGDVTGAPNGNVVRAIQSRAISPAAPSDGQVLVWSASSNSWVPQPLPSSGTGGSPNGVVVTCVTQPSGNTCVPALNTAVALTIPVAQSGAPVFCNSMNGTVAYTCSLGATRILTSYTVGMFVVLRTDTRNSGACSLNIDGLGVRAIKQKDGTTDPAAGQITGGQFYWLFYDGAVWRMQ